jgi:uncharacterized FlgJ-related protein
MNRLLSFFAVIVFVMSLPFKVNAEVSKQDQKDFIEHITGCYDWYYQQMNPNSEFEVPKQLVLGVAIHESNWGQSRFALEGYNFYGIRTVSKDPEDYMVPKYAPNVKVAKYLHSCNSTFAFIDLMIGSSHYEEAMTMIKNSNSTKLNWIKILKSINKKYSVSENWPERIAFIIKSTLS